MWRDDAAIRTFCTAHGLEPPRLWFGPLTAFRAVVDAYADAHGEDRPRGTQLQVAGIPMFFCALENRERLHVLYPDKALTDDDWDFIVNAEQHTLARGA